MVNVLPVFQQMFVVLHQTLFRGRWGKTKQS
jgi:hypothetical protein